MDALIIAAWISAYLGLLVTTFLKGKTWMAVISIVIGGPFVTIFGAARLAKPNSWWARRFYDPTKISRSHTRFPGATTGEYIPPPPAEMFR
jgi:hypothetical protein